MKRKLVKMIAALMAVLCLGGCGSNSTEAEDPVAGSEVWHNDNEVTDTGEENTEENSEVQPEEVYVGEAKISSGVSLLETNISMVDSVSQLHPEENIMISALSLNYALAMLANGASPEALEVLEDFLGMDVESANAYYSAFLDREASATDNKLRISNSFWINENKECEIRDTYIQKLQTNYKAELGIVPFNQDGIDKINAWVENATDGLISEVVGSSDLTENSASILVNAILLDGRWEAPFATDDTWEREFTLADNRVITIDGMHSQEYYYYENDYATGFRKDYQGGEYYMVAVLPKQVGDFTLESLDLEGFLQSGQDVNQLGAELHIMLPKTDFETKYDLSDILKNSGLEQIFDGTANNFSGIYANDNPDFCSYASKIIQNDRLIIDEEGTKAAAVTSVILDVLNSAIVEKEILNVYLDRPFAILLMDGATDEPLFIAKIMNP